MELSNPASQRGGQQSHVPLPNGSRFGGLVMCYKQAVPYAAARISVQAAEGGAFFVTHQIWPGYSAAVGVGRTGWLQPGESWSRRRQGGMGLPDARCKVRRDKGW